CPAETQNCTSGFCLPCASGTRDCNSDSSDACETNLNLTDSCGTTCANKLVCPTTTGPATCLAGACGTEIAPLDCAGNITPGDVTISTGADLTAFQTAGTTCISGNLTIQSTALTNLTGLGALQWVGGSVNIYSNGTLANLTGLDHL